MMKKMLSMISVILAMGFMSMSTVSAMEFEPSSDFKLSYENPAVDPAIPIFNSYKLGLVDLAISNDIMEPMGSMIIERPAERISFEMELGNHASFSKAKGGGFSLAHGGKAASHI